MQVFMLVLGTAQIVLGFTAGNDSNIVIGNVWLVGSIIYGQIKK